jgi:hypothetical protein
VATPARKLYDINGHSAATDAEADSRAKSKASSRADWKTSPSPRAGDVVPGGRVVERSGRCEETVVLDRDPLEPEVWWFGHLIDGDLGKRGRLRHDRSTHETTLIIGHDGGVYASAALLVHQACNRLAVDPTYFIYDVATHRLDMRDCDCPHT